MSAGLGLCSECNSIGAIGVYADCRRALDGVHGAVTMSGLLCRDCLSARDKARKTARAEAEALRRRADKEAIARLSTVEYLQTVALGNLPASERPATGAEIAAALRHLAGNAIGSYDGAGRSRFGQTTVGVDDVIRPDGTVLRVKRFGWRSGPRVVNPPTHTYTAGEATAILHGAAEYIRALKSGNEYSD